MSFDLIFLPYVMICLTTILCWFTESKKTLIACSLLIVLSSIFFGYIEFYSSLFVVILFFLSFKVSINEQSIIEKLLILMFAILSLLFMGHYLPGFNNYKFFESVSFSSTSSPFTMYLNFDKAFVGLSFLTFSSLARGFKKVKFISFFKIVSFVYLILFLIIFPIATSLGYVSFDFKTPDFAWVWIINNLLVVCVCEEVFFRGFIQKKLHNDLKQLKYGWALAIFISSIIFALAHFKGGATLVLFSGLAGLFYGYSFYKTSRIEAAILVHFLFNLTHFFFFSYPFSL